MSDRPSATEMQPTLCSVAKRMASEHFGIRLDLSPRSVRNVEKILGAIRKEYLKSRSCAGFDGIALEYAAYIVEVIQGHFGPAHWQRDCPRHGADTFPLYWRNQVLYPYAWCRKRIYDGADDDVWTRFSSAVLGKSSRRWWQAFGRRAADAPGPSTPRHPDELPAELAAAAGPDLERPLHSGRRHRRLPPVQREDGAAQRHHPADPGAQGRAARREPGEQAAPAVQEPDIIEVLDVLGDAQVALADSSAVDADRPRDDMAAAARDRWEREALTADAGAGGDAVAAPVDPSAHGTGERQREPRLAPGPSARRAPLAGR